MADFKTWEAGGEKIVIRKDLRAPMRDGISLAADVYHGVDDKPRPVLLAMSPYGKELQSQSLMLPPQRRPSPLWDGCLEAGDIARIVKEDYAHVIADLRGSGASGGVMVGNYNAGGVPLGQDAYDLIEWIAEQPWCDGNIGMVGVSYFASMQVLAAAERPPHLKAIFVSGGHYDFYETSYHGGILWFMPRAAREGRGGDSGIAVTNIKSRMQEELSPEELAERVEARLADPDVVKWPNLAHVLYYPKNRELWYDIILNELDGEYYEERNPITLAPKIDIPVYVQINWGRGWTVDGSIELFEALRGPKKLDLLPYPPMQERPFHEVHDDMFRWYDHWLKGIDNGVMDEPAVNAFVEGTRQWTTSEQWPPNEVEYRPLYLRPRRKLSVKPEPLGTEFAAPDGFYQAPLTVTDQVEVLSWSTEPFHETTEMIGTGAAHLFVEIDTDDTNFILRLWDTAPDGKRQLVTTGYLKASHRELDDRTTEGNPYHPHTRSVPVDPGKIEEYVVRLYPFANAFKPGHRLEVELSCNEPLADTHNSLLPPEAMHLPSGRATSHKVYRDATHQSRLVLPFTTRKA
ncbi:CocE/NonD family hydrolase [Amycolatopsis cynarae]|uniref:CocE/NonD family hydrolase n=1 Tax=Amycolatopsis cynarae TaxID=2995223 RepID=A0ABY7B0D2_9PSEU|nr:CocE/NonD family hydrolase [Amycolatopsis sp. HUAS 11-8]WAL64672.1 CocE/NonD family hydrolase [Amycolatopsis sp. HUAS 11-8]